MTSATESASSQEAQSQSAQSQSAQRHQRNARGQGTRLADDIVRGTLALVERTGSDEAVTLRAVAREVGIAAPSIYAHYADREAIIMAAVVQVFDELAAAIEKAEATVSADPVQRLLAGCQAYLEYGLGHPARYGLLFSQRGVAPEDYCKPVPMGPGGTPVLAFGAEAFSLLLQAIQECVEAGVSASTDVLTDATAVWVALHGAVTLRTALPAFPWPELAAFNRQLVLPLARATG